jgi:hypothetical protein
MKCLLIMVPGKGRSKLYPETAIEYFLFHISSKGPRELYRIVYIVTFINVQY